MSIWSRRKRRSILMAKIVRKFFSDRSGATVLLFALTLFPILAFIGGAIDFARALNTKAAMQSALDAAILAAAKTPQATESERRIAASQVFEANFNARTVRAQGVMHISENNRVVSGSARAFVPTTFLSILGMRNIEVTAKNKVRIKSGLQAEIVFVLDYSGSMGHRGKYMAMKAAAIELIETLSNEGTNETVKFGLVPFSEHVYGSIPSEYIRHRIRGTTWTNCTMDRAWPFNIQVSTPLPSNKHTKWGMGSGNKYSRAYAECHNYRTRGLVIRPLTSDQRAVISQLRAMIPFRATNISLGLAFGWHLISPNPPFTEGKAFGRKDNLKIIILLTDGIQTSRANGQNNTRSERNGEQNLRDICEGVKDSDVLLITVAFDLEDIATRQRLKNCATSSAYYFNAETDAKLSTAFQEIALRLVKHSYLSR